MSIWDFMCIGGPSWTSRATPIPSFICGMRRLPGRMVFGIYRCCGVTCRRAHFHGDFFRFLSALGMQPNKKVLCLKRGTGPFAAFSGEVSAFCGSAGCRDWRILFCGGRFRARRRIFFADDPLIPPTAQPPDHPDRRH